jgi:RNA polymerase sigma factor for flagellar operon FliA
MTLTEHMAEGPQADSAEGLWQFFAESRDAGLRERLIEHYLPYARMLAAKLYANRVLDELEFGDYLHYATVGLLESIDRYDPTREAKFETYASARITGAILNGIANWSETQEQIYARKRIVSQRVESLKEAQDAPADTDALFARLAEIAIGLAVGFALEGTGMVQEEEGAGNDMTYRSVESKQMARKVAAHLESLPDNERRVIKLHYQQQLVFEDIARILNLSKGRISQIHKSALKRLRAGFGSGIDMQC